MKIKILILLSVFFIPVILFTQENGKIFLRFDYFNNQRGLYLVQNWKFSPENNPEFANPQYNDSTWENTDTWLYKGTILNKSFKGSGWFRLKITIDSSLVNKGLTFNIMQGGRSTIFLDGVFLKTLPGKNESVEFNKIVFKEKREYLLAIFYENPNYEVLVNAGFSHGFAFLMNREEYTFLNQYKTSREITILQIFFAAIPLVFAFLHIILFIYSPSSKSNLFYALALIFYSAATFMDYQASYFSSNMFERLVFLRIHRMLNPFSLTFFLLFIYSLFYKKRPVQFYIFIFIFLLSGIYVFIKPADNYPFYVVVSSLSAIEILRVIIIAIRKKYDGAKIIAFGFISLYIFSLYDALLDLGIMHSIGEIENMYFIGSIGLFISTSIYLARDFSRTSKKLLDQEKINREREIERRLLESDNHRKSQELEDARNLQLSMLPKEIPKIEGIEIAVYMKTAFEVGGDYYDFFKIDKNNLLIAIGDATGHGAKSGNMVSIMKSLLSASKITADFPFHFNEWSKIIKQMNLGNLFMGLALLNINQNSMKISSAGMPPAFILHPDNTLEDIIMKSMPLGASLNFPYTEIRRDLSKGDIVLLLSDGYLEQFDETGEMLDISEFKTYLTGLVNENPKTIISRLMEKHNNRINNNSQTDDITFVVFKIT